MMFITHILRFTSPYLLVQASALSSLCRDNLGVLANFLSNATLAWLSDYVTFSLVKHLSVLISKMR